MRKLALVVMLVSFIAIGFSTISAVSAQDDQQPQSACTEDELNSAVQNLESIQTEAGNLNQQYNLEGDATNPDYGKTILALDGFDATYWNKDYPQIPNCAQAQAYGYLLGSAFDQSLTASLLYKASAWLYASGDSDSAAGFDQQAKRHEQFAAQTMDKIHNQSLTDLAADMNPEELPSCTEDQTDALATSVSSDYAQVSDALNQLSDQPMKAFSAIETVTYSFMDQEFPNAMTCKENGELAYTIMGGLNEGNIIAGLTADAAQEANASSADIAQQMSDSASQRLAEFYETWDALGQQFGLSTTDTPDATAES